MQIKQCIQYMGAGEESKCLELLKKEPSIVWTQLDEKLRNLGHFAARSGCLEVLKYLLENSIVTQDDKDSNDLTPLDHALLNNQTNIIHYLFLQENKFSSDLSRAIYFKEDISNLVLPNKSTENSMAIIYASALGNLAAIMILKPYYIFNPNFNPLIIALGAGHVDVAKYWLRERGFDYPNVFRYARQALKELIEYRLDTIKGISETRILLTEASKYAKDKDIINLIIEKINTHQYAVNTKDELNLLSCLTHAVEAGNSLTTSFFLEAINTASFSELHEAFKPLRKRLIEKIIAAIANNKFTDLVDDLLNFLQKYYFKAEGHALLLAENPLIKAIKNEQNEVAKKIYLWCENNSIDTATALTTCVEVDNLDLLLFLLNRKTQQSARDKAVVCALKNRRLTALYNLYKADAVIPTPDKPFLEFAEPLHTSLGIKLDIETKVLIEFVKQKELGASVLEQRQEYTDIAHSLGTVNLPVIQEKLEALFVKAAPLPVAVQKSLGKSTVLLQESYVTLFLIEGLLGAIYTVKNPAQASTFFASSKEHFKIAEKINLRALAVVDVESILAIVIADALKANDKSAWEYARMLESYIEHMIRLSLYYSKESINQLILTYLHCDQYEAAKRIAHLHVTIPSKYRTSDFYIHELQNHGLKLLINFVMFKELDIEIEEVNNFLPKIKLIIENCQELFNLSDSLNEIRTCHYKTTNEKEIETYKLVLGTLIKNAHLYIDQLNKIINAISNNKNLADLTDEQLSILQKIYRLKIKIYNHLEGYCEPVYRKQPFLTFVKVTREKYATSIKEWQAEDLKIKNLFDERHRERSKQNRILKQLGSHSTSTAQAAPSSSELPTATEESSFNLLYELHFSGDSRNKKKILNTETEASQPSKSTKINTPSMTFFPAVPDTKIDNPNKPEQSSASIIYTDFVDDVKPRSAAVILLAKPWSVSGFNSQHPTAQMAKAAYESGNISEAIASYKELYNELFANYSSSLSQENSDAGLTKGLGIIAVILGNLYYEHAILQDLHEAACYFASALQFFRTDTYEHSYARQQANIIKTKLTELSTQVKHNGISLV